MLMVSMPILHIFAQDSADSNTWSKSEALRVYLDCSRCDIDYIRTEIDYVNYVWDRKNAQLHILITHEHTGSGGRKYTCTFIGRQEFRSMGDTLTYVTNRDMSDDEIRKGMVRTLVMGLLRYIAKTPLAHAISVEVHTQKSTPIQDKWYHWIFELDLFSRIEGQQSENVYDLFGRLGAERITPDWKIKLETKGSYEKELFNYTDEDGQSVETQSIREFWNANATVIKSLSQHWSAGFFSTIGASSYRNIARNYAFYPGIEYNIYPYSESTRREIRLQYRIGYEYNHYLAQTIYNQIKENCPRNRFIGVIEYTQPWGDFETTLEISTYLHDLTKNRVEIFSDLEIHLIKGLSLDLYGRYSIIHDQIYLSQADLTQEQILLRQRDLETSYRYEFRIGLSYAFGSIYNNVVNRRFDRY